MSYNTDHVPPGTVLFNGRVMPEELRQNYNYQSDRIKLYQDAGRPVPEHLLNGRHNLIASFIYVTSNPK